MAHSARPTQPTWLLAFQLALILSSIALVVLPGLRVAPVVPVFYAAVFANCAIWMRREWKSGRLRMTPGQVYERALAGERMPRQTMALCAAVASSIAMWNVPMS